ncbi:MAG: hypothetical protein QM767_27290, partial [Anaeromyxobacter sp.]
MGRFAGATAVGYLVLVAVALGVWAGALMPWVDPEKLGPFRPGDYAYALAVVALPTALLISAAFFALATGTRSMTATYVGAVAFLAAYFVAVLLAARPEHERLVSLLDPFGIGPLQ